MASSSAEDGLLRQLCADIDCVFERDPAARNRFEVWTTYPGVHAIIAYRIAHRLWRNGWCYAARLLTYFSRTWTGIDIHPGAQIGRRFFIDHGAGVVIGETAEVGNDVILYHGVTLGGTSWSKGKRHPTLGDGVIVGAGAKVLGPVVLGDGAKVGANSVVIRSVAERRTVVGIPGKVVQSTTVGNLNPYGIDLNHHLISDPVADAMSCMLERITQLEQALQITAAPGCRVCDADLVCEQEAMPPLQSVAKG